MAAPGAIYRPRNSQSSNYYRCGEEHCETFVQFYEDRFERQYGFYRPYIQKVIYRYLVCVDLHNCFARVKYKSWSPEYFMTCCCYRYYFQSVIFNIIYYVRLRTCRWSFLSSSRSVPS